MRPVILRLVACGLVAVGWAGSATAQVPVLRGSNSYQISSPLYRDWSGFYFGGQVGYPSAAIGFSQGVGSVIANILRVTTVQDEFSPSGWATLPKKSINRESYGGFIGYNVQFGEIIFGIEANYNRTSMRASSGDTVARQVQTSDGYINQVTVSGTNEVYLTDYGTLRARAAWVYNSFIPYGFLAVAVGRASVARTAGVTLTGTDADPGNPPVLPNINFSASQSDGKNNAFSYGWAIGAGLDWALFSNVFLRGEYEYLSFPNFQGVDIVINSVRAGVGIRF